MLMCICGAVSFGLLATASKFAECFRSYGFCFCLGSSFHVRSDVPSGRPCSNYLASRDARRGLGVCAAVAYFAFQRSIDVGNVTVGWLMMNLSAGVPALVSLWLYGEKMSLMSFIAFVLALVSLLCLFQGNRLEAKGKSRAEA